MTVRLILLAGTLGAVLAACQAPPPATAGVAPALDRPVLAFAQAACGGCHAVEHDRSSPEPLAPEWPRIVNTPGLTGGTLRTWLVDAHNYPEEMDFDLDRPQVDDLVTYMMTLQREGYQPPIL